jgi:ribulose-5-phosphate 4-epimerase/fuculose-1-phosphate aldolase
MDIKQALSFLTEHCIPAVASGVLTADDRVSFRDGDNMWITREGAKLSSLKGSDIITFDVKNNALYSDRIAEIHSVLYAAHKRLGAIINSRTQYSLSVSRTGETVRPYVDDIAQIAGIDIKCIEPGNTGRIKSLIKRRSALLLKDSGSMCADISLDDALATAMITEKACRIHIQSRYLGGAKPINVIESALMRFIYLKKYSKIKY